MPSPRKLTHRIRREVPRPRQPLILTLEPTPSGDDILVTVREKSRRRGFTITAGILLVILAQRAADLRRLQRGRGRGGRL